MKTIKTATVYLGSSANGPEKHKQDTILLGQELARRNIKLCYGGMNAGLMYLVAESCLQAGGHVTGVVPSKLKDSDRTKQNLDELIIVESMWERKRLMFETGDVIFTLPGGYGTIDEAIEALFWAELGLHKKPVVFLNTDNYWYDMIEFLNKNVEQMPNAPYNFKDFMIVADTVQEAFEKLDQWQKPQDLSPEDRPHLPHFEDEIMSNQDEPYLIIENRVDDIYKLSASIALKQLGAHHRPIGILDTNQNFIGFVKWAEHAQKTRYITNKCIELFDVENNMNDLQNALQLSANHKIIIDLEKEKWGDKPNLTTKTQD